MSLLFDSRALRRLLSLVVALAVTFAMAAPAAKAKHVVLIGCDGLGTYALRKADP